MSFGINGPDNLPAIQKSHHTNDGGAGNLGYFQRDGNKKQQQNKKDEHDIFELSSKEESEEEENFDINLDSIGTKIKNFWLKIHNKSEEEKKSEDQ